MSAVFDWIFFDVIWTGILAAWYWRDRRYVARVGGIFFALIGYVAFLPWLTPQWKVLPVSLLMLACGAAIYRAAGRE